MNGGRGEFFHYLRLIAARLLSVENRTDGGFSGESPFLDMQMLYERRRKWRSPVNYPSISANRGGRTGVGATHSRSRFSGGLNKDARRPMPCPSGNYRSDRFVRPRPEGHEWEPVQEMFLASRSKFIGLAYTILRNKEDAEDAVQDAFMSACRHLRSFEGRSAFTTWFTRIVLNAALMIRRKRKPSWTEPHLDSRTMDDTPWTERIPAAQPDPEMAYAEGETFQLMDVLLGNMSPILRQAFTMTYYEEMSNEEAGALLGITTGTFKSRLLRARRHLRKQTRHSLVAPIRRVTHNPFSSGKSNSRSIIAGPAEISFSEIAF
jgi:RNA polymerase sigma-70 factor, ECF subfamily